MPIMTGNEQYTRSSVHVAPLFVYQMTPSATPNGSEENLSQQIEAPHQVFHNYLRAFHSFHPTCSVSDTTVTLPLNQGDMILVHSIHTNGWADGTLLISGARGWLPRNYCKAYGPEPMRTLLKALQSFWDRLCSRNASDNEEGGNEFMGGIIAGIRYLLVRITYTLKSSILTF
jgi:hypothetical protein